MFELTNAQRSCFGLRPVEEGWRKFELKASPYDSHSTYAYADGNIIRKCIRCGTHMYSEWELCETLSADGKHLEPRTNRGKPALLSASTLSKRMPIGMSLRFESSIIDLYNCANERVYYCSIHEKLPINTLEDFRKWVEAWCADTSEQDLVDVAAFAALPRKHVRYREGDVFRFRLNRRLYGYGRLLLDYGKMRRTKEPFWNILAGQPLCCAVYRIATPDPNVTVESLQNLPSLPSFFIMDNRLYYGDYEIIGNLPIRDREDYPIMYGESLSVRDNAVMLQCGRLFCRKEGIKPLDRSRYNMGSISFHAPVSLKVLQECIAAGSNDPYWQDESSRKRPQCDLRNPAHRDHLKQACAQFGLRPEDLLF